MHFMWIAQRLVSSRSPNKYASAASCMVRMACTWKCMLYLLTSRAISWTRFEKGSLHIRRSTLFWNCQISQRATVPSWYLQGFFTFPTLRSSFWGSFHPKVGQSFLLAGSSLPYIDGSASASIWANCQVGDDSSNLPTSPNFSVSSTLFSSSLWVGLLGLLALGGPPVLGVLVPVFSPPSPSCLPHFMASHLFWPCWNLKKDQLIRSQSSLVRVSWHPFWIFN